MQKIVILISNSQDISGKKKKSFEIELHFVRHNNHTHTFTWQKMANMYSVVQCLVKLVPPSCNSRTTLEKDSKKHTDLQLWPPSPPSLHYHHCPQKASHWWERNTSCWSADLSQWRTAGTKMDLVLKTQMYIGINDYHRNNNVLSLSVIRFTWMIVAKCLECVQVYEHLKRHGCGCDKISS